MLDDNILLINNKEAPKVLIQTSYPYFPYPYLPL